MRRVISVILFVLGGWMLMTEMMVAWMDMQEGAAAQLFVMAILLPFAAIPLAFGTWASPGNRLADLGLALMVTAGISAFLGTTIFMAMNDPEVENMMPPGQSMPDIPINAVTGAINLLLVTGAGYMLWRKGRGRAKAKATDLERVFGDG
jgi:hypothetical protein